MRNLASLNPSQIANDPAKSKEKLKRVVNRLDHAKRIKSKDCDDVIWQYNYFFYEAVGSKFHSYEPYSENSRLDKFFYEEIGTKKEYGLLFDVIKLCLCLSHGQATVERGFFINADLIVEDLKEGSITAQRIVYDNVSFAGGVLEIPLTKEFAN